MKSLNKYILMLFWSQEVELFQKSKKSKILIQTTSTFWMFYIPADLDNHEYVLSNFTCWDTEDRIRF